MKSVKHHDKELAHVTPHQLRHTRATLAKHSGTVVEDIFETLTHRDTLVTKTYTDTMTIVLMAVGDITYHHLYTPQKTRVNVIKNRKKTPHGVNHRVFETLI